MCNQNTVNITRNFAKLPKFQFFYTWNRCLWEKGNITFLTRSRNIAISAPAQWKMTKIKKCSSVNKIFLSVGKSRSTNLNTSIAVLIGSSQIAKMLPEMLLAHGWQSIPESRQIFYADKIYQVLAFGWHTTS